MPDPEEESRGPGPSPVLSKTKSKMTTQFDNMEQNCTDVNLMICIVDTCVAIA